MTDTDANTPTPNAKSTFLVPENFNAKGFGLCFYVCAFGFLYQLKCKCQTEFKTMFSISAITQKFSTVKLSKTALAEKHKFN